MCVCVLRIHVLAHTYIKKPVGGGGGQKPAQPYCFSFLLAKESYKCLSWCKLKYVIFEACNLS